MGTRADFYVGRGPDAEWIGSVAWDGYPEGFDRSLFEPCPEHEWRERVAAMLAARADGTTPEMGWPWPWDNSGTTDCAYAFDDGFVYTDTRSRWLLVSEYLESEDPDDINVDELMPVEFPDMSARKNVTYGSRSGVMLIGPGGPIDPKVIDAERDGANQ